MKKDVIGDTVLGFRVPRELLDRLDQLAAADQRSRSQMARLLIEEAMRRKEQPQSPAAHHQA